jgi:SAM-dependent methyltransferase
VPENHFGERVADRYDESVADLFEPAVLDPVVDFLADQAGEGAAVELGIGTGRIALPLARRGIRVHGIDLSEAMVARLRAKPGSDQIGVTIGDFASTRVDGAFSVAYLVFNTIMNLTTQDQQVACFRNVAAHLEPGGCFLIEVAVPDLRRLPPGETVRPFAVAPTRLGFDEYDVASQGLISHHYTVEEGELEVLSVPFRYVWPAELDLMARLAGMTLRERWSGWEREPFTNESRQHVSVWSAWRARTRAEGASQFPNPSNPGSSSGPTGTLLGAWLIFFSPPSWCRACCSAACGCSGTRSRPFSATTSTGPPSA